MKIAIIALKILAYIWSASVIGFITLCLIGIALKDGFDAMIMQGINPISAAVNQLLAAALLAPGIVIHAIANLLAKKYGIKASKAVSTSFTGLLLVYMVGLMVWTVAHAFIAKGILAAVASLLLFFIAPLYWIYHQYTATHILLSPYTIVAFIFYPIAFTWMIFAKDE